ATSAVTPATVPLDTEGFSSDARSAPSDGNGIGLLSEVRLGRHQGFDRIVFEFAGTAVPGYRIDWIEGEAIADGSGHVVQVAGSSTLGLVLQPASGVDMETGQTSYAGPDRPVVEDEMGVLRDLVRTG